MNQISVATRSKNELVDLTDRVKRVVDDSGVQVGTCTVYCPHTTAGLVVNECADPSVAHDISGYLETLVQRDWGWTHAEGNSPAHVKASLIGESVRLIVEDGCLQLGTWQGIFFCEFDGPRQRKVWVSVQA